MVNLHSSDLASLGRLPLTANFHFLRNCNFRCNYCFATFLDSTAVRSALPFDQLAAITKLLARRYTKVTFVGGEPTLLPRLPELLTIAKNEGALTNLVTNGYQADPLWIEAQASRIDFLTLSIDSDNPATHQAVGRVTRRGDALPIEHYRLLVTAAKASGINVKVNTVVTTLNQDEDITGFIRDLRPARWKILQAAPVQGQNDRHIEALTPERSAFDRYVARHQALADDGIRIIAEPVELIRGSYIMVDPQGRFFDSTSGRHHYSRPILEVGLDAAFAEVQFDSDSFVSRDGDADYVPASGVTIARNRVAG